MTATTGSTAPRTGPLHTFKVLVAGSFAVGKSTLIRQVSDSEVVGTEAPTSGDESEVKATTTVGMEFGTFTVGSDDEAIQLLLHGLPGQERFGFMWEIVAEGADGFLIVADVTRAETVDEATSMVERVRAEGDTPLLVALNRADEAPEATAALAAELDRSGIAWAPCHVLDAGSVRSALVELLLLVLDRLEGSEGGP